jgi:hypothetical protein
LRSLNDIATLPDQLRAFRERPAACCDKASSIIQHVLGFDLGFVFGPHNRQQTRTFLAIVNLRNSEACRSSKVGIPKPAFQALTIPDRRIISAAVMMSDTQNGIRRRRAKTARARIFV